MSFNVCDKYGRHIGFIKDSYPYYANVFRVALTEDRIENKSGELDEIKGRNKDEFIKYLLLKNSTDVEKHICFDTKNIKGYILLDIDKINIENNTVILNEDLDYIEDMKLDEETPVYARVATLPVVTTDIMGLGTGLLLGADIADLGGRNHIHTTRFKMQSGNSITDIEVPAQLGIRKGMNIQLYFNGNKISKVFCDGVIYVFN